MSASLPVFVQTLDIGEGEVESTEHLGRAKVLAVRVRGLAYDDAGNPNPLDFTLVLEPNAARAFGNDVRRAARKLPTIHDQLTNPTPDDPADPEGTA